jgi:hypothetical protein
LSISIAIHLTPPKIDDRRSDILDMFLILTLLGMLAKPSLWDYARGFLDRRPDLN